MSILARRVASRASASMMSVSYSSTFISASPCPRVFGTSTILRQSQSQTTSASSSITSATTSSSNVLATTASSTTPIQRRVGTAFGVGVGIASSLLATGIIVAAAEEKSESLASRLQSKIWGNRSVSSSPTSSSSAADARITKALEEINEVKSQPGALVEGVPFYKLQKPTTSLPKLILVECGSFSPVTMLHLQLFELNRDYLMKETKQVEVVGGIVSPVHDLYGKKSLVHQNHRGKRYIIIYYYSLVLSLLLLLIDRVLFTYLFALTTITIIMIINYFLLLFIIICSKHV